MNRSELYEAVWSKPLFHVARQLGVGERVLAAACKRAAIPTPPRGYWRKVATGQPGVRPPLGDAPNGKEAVTVPREVAPQRSAPKPPAKPWPSNALQGDELAITPAASRLDFSAPMVDAVVDALAAEYQRAEARRALLSQVIGALSECAGPDAPAMRRTLELLRNFGSHKIVEAAAFVISAATTVQPGPSVSGGDAPTGGA